jgi:hypothetical protein
MDFSRAPSPIASKRSVTNFARATLTTFSTDGLIACRGHCDRRIAPLVSIIA